MTVLVDLGLCRGDRVAARVVPLAGVLNDRPVARWHGNIGSGIAHAALEAVDDAGGVVDLVILAVPAGRGREIAGAIVLGEAA